MADQPQDPTTDVPPAVSPGGASAADGFVQRARGRASAPRPTSGPRSRSGAGAPTTDQPEQEAPKRRTPKWGTLREGVLELYTGAQIVAFMADPLASELIRQNKERCADAWIDLAQKDPKVAKILERITQGAGWGAVFAAHLPILLPVLMKRGVLPGGALFDGAGFAATGMTGQGQATEGPAPWPGDAPFPGVVGFSGNGANGGGASA